MGSMQRIHLFGAKTQGFPYHALIVALGMLVEHALPGTAVVYGQISASDCEQAQRGVASILDELAFLCGAICMHTTRWEVHHAVRAVLENRVLRGA